MPQDNKKTDFNSSAAAPGSIPQVGTDKIEQATKQRITELLSTLEMSLDSGVRSAKISNDPPQWKSDEQEQKTSSSQVTPFDGAPPVRKRIFKAGDTAPKQPTVEPVEPFEPVGPKEKVTAPKETAPKEKATPTVETKPEATAMKPKENVFSASTAEKTAAAVSDKKSEPEPERQSTESDSDVTTRIRAEFKSAVSQSADAPQNDNSKTSSIPTAQLDVAAKKVEKRGLLNVQDNVDDDFREFFSNTVIIDNEPLSKKARRQRVIKDFVMADEKNKVGGPVFEEETESTDEIDYRSDADTEPVLKKLTADKSKTTVVAVVTGALALLLCILSLLNELHLLSSPLSSPALFYSINALLLAAGIALNARRFFSGLGKLFSFKAGGIGVVAFSYVLSMIEALVLALTAESVENGASAAVALTALFVCDLGYALDASRILDSFRTVSENYDKYASSVLKNDSFAVSLTRELEIGSPSVLIKRKTGFTDDFLKSATSRPHTGSGIPTAAFICAILSVACGIAAGYLKSDIATGIRYAALASAFTSPFIATLSTLLPMVSVQKYLSKYSAVIPGYSSARDVCSANCVVLEGRELFPKGNVMLHGIKTFERERIDKAILYAASVLIQSCDTMSHVFMNVIQGKTEMLYDVDSVEYETGRGFSFWIGKTRMLLGTRDLMRAHEIELPSRDYENRYTKTSTRDAVYLAVSGRLYAMFVLSYSPNAEVESALHSFEREGVSILVHTRDFNLTPEKISTVYHIPRRMISVVRESDMEELSARTEYVGHTTSSLTHIGSLTSFVKGIIACYNVRSAAGLSETVEIACMVLGAIVAALLAFTGTLSSVGVLCALMFQLICTLLLVTVLVVRKY